MASVRTRIHIFKCSSHDLANRLRKKRDTIPLVFYIYAHRFEPDISAYTASKDDDYILEKMDFVYTETCVVHAFNRQLKLVSNR